MRTRAEEKRVDCRSFVRALIVSLAAAKRKPNPTRDSVTEAFARAYRDANQAAAQRAKRRQAKQFWIGQNLLGCVVRLVLRLLGLREL